TIKEGIEATHAKRKGKEMEIVKRNDEIKQRNSKAENLDMSILKLKQDWRSYNSSNWRRQWMKPPQSIRQHSKHCMSISSTARR
ncbi:hypothetical protein, partial [Acinetobacter guerrae]|uniref:hypothetical protein n=1 Tax=Acinetobacter guerrae TaxID=1843371 RepID=UPI00148F0E3C